MGRQYYSLVTKCEPSMEARQVIEEAFDQVSSTIKAMMPTIEDAAEAHQHQHNTDIETTKGRSKRAKSGIERKKAESEFGSNRPNPLLF